MSLLDIADFNPNLFGKHGDTEKKEEDDEDATTTASSTAAAVAVAAASAGRQPGGKRSELRVAAIATRPVESDSKESSESESDEEEEETQSETAKRQKRQHHEAHQQKKKVSPLTKSGSSRRRGRLSESDEENNSDSASSSEQDSLTSSRESPSKPQRRQQLQRAQQQHQRQQPQQQPRTSGGGRSLREAIDVDPELWGVRRSGRSRREPTRLEVGAQQGGASDEEVTSPTASASRRQRKRRRGSTAASASGGKRRRSVAFTLSSGDDDDDGSDSGSGSSSSSAGARRRRRGGGGGKKQLRSRRGGNQVRSYRELSTSGDDNASDGDDRQRQQRKQQSRFSRHSGGGGSASNASQSSAGQLKPSNKLHPMLRTATDVPPRQAAGSKYRPENRGAIEATLRPLRKFSSHGLTGKAARKSDSDANNEEELDDDEDEASDPGAAAGNDSGAEPSQEEIETRLSHSDFLAPPLEDNEGIERVLNYRIGRRGATGDKTTFYNILEEKDPNDGFDPSREEGDVQFFIKWRGWSHLHNTWESMDSLSQKCVDGLKKILNFKQRVEEIHDWKKSATPEELEGFNYHEEVNENLLAEHRQVERIVAHSKAPAGGYSDYYCKWAGLPYSECSWEDGQLVTKLFLSSIEEYEARLKSQTLPNKNCKALKYRPKFRQLKEQPKYLSPLNPDNRLRDYQLEGINWLCHSWTRGYSSILSDEMGLGKTIQTISFLSVLFHEHEIYGPFLLVVPLSTVIGWKREFATWAPQMNIVVYLGDVDSRNIIRSYEWQQVNRRLKFNVCLTTYEILLKDRGWLGAVSWALLGVDEAHRLKNDDSLLYKTLIDFDTNTRLLITGTPLQNSLRELWALLHFIQPDTFDNWPEFEEAHGDKQLAGFERLHKQLEPYLLRRVKKDVEKSLPPKTESILRVEMSRQQKQFYKWILTRNYKMLNKPNAFLNLIMELKKCCNHTFLVHDPPQQSDRCERLEGLIRGSGKMLLIDKLLWNLRAGGHRVLIFSQMVMMLDVLAGYLSLRNWSFQRLDGTILGEARKQALDAFNAENSQDFCFLLSTRAGGLGVNLATADTVIIFDSDWNPQNDLQAMARCHRIGQTRQVRVYRLVLRATVEEDIIERAKQKMVLDHLVIQRMDTTGRLRQPGDQGNAFSKDELSSILKFGAEDLFREKEGEETEAEVDLDAILRSAETREETQPTSAAAEQLLSQFKVVNLENLEDSEIIMTGPPGGRRKGQATATNAVSGAAATTDSEGVAGAASKSWEDIIPEESRRRMEQEEAEERLLQLELGPRQRKQVKPLNVGAEDEEELSDREIRALAKAMRKFAQPVERLDSVVEEAELQEKSEAEVRRLVEAIMQGCEKAVAKVTTESTAADGSEGGGGGKSRGGAASFTLGRVVIQARPLLQAQQDLGPLHREMPTDREARRKYRLPFHTKTVAWDCVWDEIDDSNLLIGIYEFGMDSWDAIKEDPDLGLRAKILRDHNLKPQAAHLRTRVDYLLRLLRRHSDGGSSGGGGGASTGGVSSGGRRSRNSTATAASSLSISSVGAAAAAGHKEQQPISKEFVDSSDSSSSSSLSRSNSPVLGGKPAVGTAASSAKQASATNTALHITANREPVSIQKAKQQQQQQQQQHKKKQQSKASSPTKKGSKQQQQAKGGAKEGDAPEERLSEQVFNACKEHMRPLKKALKRLQDSEADKGLVGSHLLKIGNHIGHEIRRFNRPEEIRSWRNRLWTFVSYFTELSHSELHRLYKKCRKEAKAAKQQHQPQQQQQQQRQQLTQQQQQQDVRIKRPPPQQSHSHYQSSSHSRSSYDRAEASSSSSAAMFNNAYNRRPTQPGGKHY